MKGRKILVLVLLISVIAIPLAIIISNESFLSNTEAVYKFSLQPVDPFDPIRGKYIILRYNTRMEVETDKIFGRGESIFVEVAKDSAGWAYFKAVHSTPPATDAFFETRVTYSYTGYVNFEVPFDRYYMNEDQAQEAETMYNELSRNGTEFYAEVTIKDGKALLKEVYYQGEPLRDFLDKN